jgi:tetratricopeptide (TPR) repeat protein
MKLFKSSSVHIIITAVLGLLVYSNTFHVPFQWDDKHYFTEKNEIIKDLKYFTEPSKAVNHVLYGEFKRRYIGYLSFALNYRLHGFDVFGYHVVNLLIHIFNGILVYILVLLAFSTPFLESSRLKGSVKYIALFSGLFFVSHPVQTQAVTYVVQRIASLAAFFYLLSIVAYAVSRLEPQSVLRYLFYSMSIISAVLAMKTKEISFTLPVVIAAFELLFFKGPVKRRIMYLIPLFLAMFIIPFTLIEVNMSLDKMLHDFGWATRLDTDMSRLDYLFTQLRVHVTYLRLLFLPVNQNIDYDYPVFRSLFNMPTIFSLSFLLSVLGMGVYLFFRSRASDSVLRLTAFGIFWVFITLSVESSIIPILDVSFEHRVYLPSIGAFCALTTGAFLLAERFRRRKIKTVVSLFLIAITLMFTYLAYARNAVWRSEILLWEDAVIKSPGKARVHYNLALAYHEKDLQDKAVKHYRHATELKPDYAGAYYNMGNIYFDKGIYEQAIEHYRMTAFLKRSLSSHYTLADVYLSVGKVDEAIETFHMIIKLDPENPRVYNDIGVAFASKGLTGKAIEHFGSAIKLDPGYVDAHNNIGIAYLSEGFVDKAVSHFSTAVRLRPEVVSAYLNLGKAYYLNGMIDEAIEQNRMVVGLEPDNVRAHSNLTVLYREKGFLDKAEEHYHRARQLQGLEFRRAGHSLPPPQGAPPSP